MKTHDNGIQSVQLHGAIGSNGTAVVRKSRLPLPKTKANEALSPQQTPHELFTSPLLQEQAFFADDETLIFNAEARDALDWIYDAGIRVDCIVTSPPFYGQRDYGSDAQIGLEEHPSQFIDALVGVFEKCGRILKGTGSLWVNLGDTYWSGKGRSHGSDIKQSARRFGLRPQDTKGDGLWCRPKQLLLIPHRFAIAMQDAGWIVRNDNVWIKPNPIPDPVRDRCSISHEYVFHFVKERWYYFDRDAIARPTAQGAELPPLDTWVVPPSRGIGGHKAAFSEELVSLPIRATTPQGGVVLDPFAGSGTTLCFAQKMGLRSIGIDISREFCQLTAKNLHHPVPIPVQMPLEIND